MTMDPRRLSEDPAFPASLRADLTLATDVGVEGLDFAAGAAALQGALAAEPAASVAGASAAAKVIVGVVALGGAVGLWALRGGGDIEPPPTTVAAQVSGAELAHEPSPAEPEVVVEPVIEEEEPTLVDDIEIDAASPPEVPEPQTEAKRKPSHARRSAASPDFRREAQLVARARNSLSTDPDKAWRITKKLAREFPGGLLVEEREAIAIRALAELGRLPEARRRARVFLVEHGDGPHADAIRRAVEM